MDEYLVQIKKLLLSNKKVLIVLPRIVTGDIFLAGSALFRELRTIADSGPVFENVDMIIPSAISTGLENSVDEKTRELFKESLESRSYIISFPYSNGIEKVSYKIEEGRFKMFLASPSGELDLKDLSLEVSGADYDLVVMLGFDDKAFLEELFSDNKQFLKTTEAASVSMQGTGESSNSALIFKLLKSLNISISEKSAQMLLEGILYSTRGAFQGFGGTLAMEVINSLLERGAVIPSINRVGDKSSASVMVNLHQKLYSNLRQSSALGVLWSKIEQGDLQMMGLLEEDIDIHQPIIFNCVQGFDRSFVLYELSEDRTMGRLELENGNALKLLKGYSPVGTENAIIFIVDKPVAKIEQEMLSLIGDLVQEGGAQETRLEEKVEESEEESAYDRTDDELVIEIEQTEEISVESVEVELADTVIDETGADADTVAPQKEDQADTVTETDTDTDTDTATRLSGGQAETDEKIEVKKETKVDIPSKDKKGFVPPIPLEAADEEGLDYEDQPIVSGDDENAQFGPPKIFNSRAQAGRNPYTGGANTARGAF